MSVIIKDVDKWSYQTLLLGMRNVVTITENYFNFLKRLNICQLYYPAILLIKTKFTQNPVTNIDSVRFIIPRNWKGKQYPKIGLWLNKLQCIHTTDYYSAIKHSRLLTHAKS